MFLVYVNYFAVLLCGIAATVVGYFWYGSLFGKAWMKLVGQTKEKMQKNMSRKSGLMFLSSIVMAYALAHFVWYAAPGSLTVVIGIKTALWAWIGFVATYGFSKQLFTPDRYPMKLFAIDAGYYLVTLVMMGLIFAVLH